ncbi:MAG TPA: hypothetical protein VM686_28685, partial [Polyangiaceae bacterium]|nr:hypothetical protein [Polyangiaceae bacterium]
MSERFLDWQLRLEACLAERWSRAFAWAQQDCALFAADCVLACTGIDPAMDVRGRYWDARSAQRLIQRLGGLAAICDARLGPRITPTLAQPGDVGLLSNDGHTCLGVCSGAGWLGPGALGVAVLPGDAACLAWRLTTEVACHR